MDASLCFFTAVNVIWAMYTKCVLQRERQGEGKYSGDNCKRKERPKSFFSSADL